MAKRNDFLRKQARAKRGMYATTNRDYISAILRDVEFRRTSLEQKRLWLATQPKTRDIKAEEKELKAQYEKARIAEVEGLNKLLQQEVLQLENLLHATLEVDDYFDINSLKITPVFSGATSSNGKPEKPNPQAYKPEPLTNVQKLLPGAEKRYKKEWEQARDRYKADLENYKRHLQILTHNKQVDEFNDDFVMGVPEAVVDYFVYVLEASVYPDNFPQHAKLAYEPASKQIVIEYDLPQYEIIPEVEGYKYVKTKDEITVTNRSTANRKALYASVIAQITIRTIHEIFEADRRTKHIESVVFNGYVDAIDRGTGRTVRECLVTVRALCDDFMTFNLARVDPQACLRVLKADVSKSPEELVPVKPVVEFKMVDPRFIEETDVLSTLDQRPNLMELSPSEFEALIANLFKEMGLETRLTQASRDGGVDCVAYDPRPILGGKVVIQAKRYKNTVGVSAVRDLYGTLQNEGASKGILVTTSGFGKAAFEFANGKPMELISGNNLLYLLETHANVKAKIVAPSTWKDPVADLGE